MVAQKAITTVFGTPSWTEVGRDVARIGDVDGDGRGDLLVLGTSGAARRLDVISSATYQPLASLPLHVDARFAGVPDLNQDGGADVVVCRLTAQAFSGTGTLLWTSPVAGDHLVACGLDDQDGDGRAEVASLVRISGVPYIVVLRGSDGTQLRISGPLTNIVGARPELISIGDITGDGDDEIAFNFGSRVDVLRTAPFVGAMATMSIPNGFFVESVTAANVTGDARNEVLMAIGRVVYVCSALNGQQLRQDHAVDDEGEITAVGDLDADGYDDYARLDEESRFGFTANPAVVFVSGATGRMLSHWSATAQFRCRQLAGVGDVDGDGVGDLLAGDQIAIVPGNPPASVGGWQLVSGRVLAANAVMPTYCTGGPFAPELGMTRPILGQSVTLVGVDVPPGTVGAVAFSVRPDMPTNLGVSGCDAWIDAGNWSVFHAPAPGPTWTHTVPLPLVPQMAGVQVALQAFYVPTFSAIGLDLSNGIWSRIGF